ncbi:MAG: polyprenyl synthetase family protein, partial [Chloroflexota bacterium]
MSVKEAQAHFQSALEEEMMAVLRADGSKPENPLFGRMQYHMGWLDEAFNPASEPAGKQIRPILLLLTCMAAGGEWEKGVPAAAAIELLHNFSLIHDDIEDDSDVRRGRKTVWKIWGMPLGINAGDAMFAASHIALGRLADRGVDAAVVVEAFRRFDETCLRLTMGQDADMLFETMPRVDIESYIEMITGKTSVLISLCAELGSLIAGADRQTIEHYKLYGLNLGLAFQMIDDLLGIWGDEAEIGKSASTDITTRKKTLPVLYALEKGEDERLMGLYDNESIDLVPLVPEIVEMLTATGARAFTQAKAKEYTDLAL